MRKVLIVTYYWPPSGGIGVNRCLKFSKYLRKFNWEPIIYTTKNANYPFIDEKNLEEIPDGITVLKKPIIEPFAAFRFLSGRKKGDAMSNPIHVRRKKSKFIDNVAIWIRGNFFIPDARSLWIKPSVRFLKKYINENPVDAILSDGPPHTNTVIACRISKKFNIPWLMDFQDPWTQVDYYSLFKLTKWANNKHHRMEQEAFKQASVTTIASPSWKSDLEKIGAANVHTIYWGYDEQDFEYLNQHLDNTFSISHAGLLGYDRNPEVLFKVLQDLKTEIEGFSKILKLKLAGMVDYEVLEKISDYGLDENLENIGTVSRKNALRLIMNSHILLLPINKAKNAKGRIPGKLFELLRTGRPILYLGPTESDVYKIINETGHGSCFEYEDYMGIKNFIVRKFKQFERGDFQHHRIDNIQEYSVENQTRLVAGYLDEIVNQSNENK